MGQTVSDTHLGFHGEGTTGHQALVRLHWGDQGIDETHSAPIALAVSWVVMASTGSFAVMRLSFENWLAASSATPVAKAKSTYFAGSLRAGLGG